MVNIPSEGIITGIKVEVRVLRQEDEIIFYTKLPKVALPLLHSIIAGHAENITLEINFREHGLPIEGG